jgi:Sel1 repeat
MRSRRIIVLLLGCALLVGGGASTWRFVKLRTAEKKLAEEAKAYRDRAELGDKEAEYKLARMYYTGEGVPQDYAQAFVWGRKSAEQGYAKAEYGISLMYEEGKGVPQDRSEALAWCYKAAAQGYVKAQYALGYSYYSGKEVPQDYPVAIAWYRKAADQGYAPAQSDLAYAYAEGKAVPQDYGEAVYWYRKAAEQGYASGEDGLGYAYHHGYGVRQDYAEAAQWYRKAAKQGDEYGRRALASMNRGFSPTSKILLSVGVLGSLTFFFTNHPRKTVPVGVMLLLWAALDIYGHLQFSTLVAFSAVNTFFLTKSLVGGISISMLIVIIWPEGNGIAVAVCSFPSVVFNIYAAKHYDLMHLGTCPIAFYSANGLLIGILVSSAILIWLKRRTSNPPANPQSPLPALP